MKLSCLRVSMLLEEDGKKRKCAAISMDEQLFIIHELSLEKIKKLTRKYANRLDKTIFGYVLKITRCGALRNGQIHDSL